MSTLREDIGGVTLYRIDVLLTAGQLDSFYDYLFEKNIRLVRLQPLNCSYVATQTDAADSVAPLMLNKSKNNSSSAVQLVDKAVVKGGQVEETQMERGQSLKGVQGEQQQLELPDKELRMHTSELVEEIQTLTNVAADADVLQVVEEVHLLPPKESEREIREVLERKETEKQEAVVESAIVDLGSSNKKPDSFTLFVYDPTKPGPFTEVNSEKPPTSQQQPAIAMTMMAMSTPLPTPQIPPTLPEEHANKIEPVYKQPIVSIAAAAEPSRALPYPITASRFASRLQQPDSATVDGHSKFTTESHRSAPAANESSSSIQQTTASLANLTLSTVQKPSRFVSTSNSKECDFSTEKQVSANDDEVPPLLPAFTHPSFKSMHFVASTEAADSISTDSSNSAAAQGAVRPVVVKVSKITAQLYSNAGAPESTSSSKLSSTVSIVSNPSTFSAAADVLESAQHISETIVQRPTAFSIAKGSRFAAVESNAAPVEQEPAQIFKPAAISVSPGSKFSSFNSTLGSSSRFSVKQESAQASHQQRQQTIGDSLGGAQPSALSSTSQRKVSRFSALAATALPSVTREVKNSTQPQQQQTIGDDSLGIQISKSSIPSTDDEDSRGGAPMSAVFYKRITSRPDSSFQQTNGRDPEILPPQTVVAPPSVPISITNSRFTAVHATIDGSTSITRQSQLSNNGSVSSNPSANSTSVLRSSRFAAYTIPSSNIGSTYSSQQADNDSHWTRPSITSTVPASSSHIGKTFCGSRDFAK